MSVWYVVSNNLSPVKSPLSILRKTRIIILDFLIHKGFPINNSIKRNLISKFVNVRKQITRTKTNIVANEKSRINNLHEVIADNIRIIVLGGEVRKFFRTS